MKLFVQSNRFQFKPHTSKQKYQAGMTRLPHLNVLPSIRLLSFGPQLPFLNSKLVSRVFFPPLIYTIHLANYKLPKRSIYRSHCIDQVKSHTKCPEKNKTRMNPVSDAPSKT
jgi:hypothetical protein